MRKTSLLITIMISLLIGMSSLVGATPITIGFSPTANSFAVTPTGSYTFDVILTGLTPSSSVSAFDLDIKYNSSLLSVSSVNMDSSIGLLGNWGDGIDVLSGLNTATPGLLNIWALSLLTDPIALQELQGAAMADGTMTFATVTFAGIGTGTGNLAFDWYNGKDVKNFNAEIIAGYVPEPGTFMLLGSGLMGVFFYRRRAKVS
ncbi:MAG: PEP-CTERM sorting domain-containing protein [Geobacteraceae bacterium]|nr:PEP-CTERM sorting domain-containing protein [Geobacteraceae bacterium]